MLESKPVTVLLADGQPLLRTGLRTVLAAQPDIHVIGEASDGPEAVELARRLQPDVVLVDFHLPRQDGLVVTRAVVSARLATRVLILADEPTDEQISAIVSAGAGGVLAKGAPSDDLVLTVRTIAAGHAVLPVAAIARLMARTAGASSPPPVPDTLSTLTDREREVLVLVARGLTNAEIAADLGVGETTVKSHVGRLLTKLDLRDRVQAVVVAYETGLVTTQTRVT